MSQFFFPAELEGLTEQELRAKYNAILGELTRKGLTIEDYPHIAITLRQIREAIARLQRRAPKPPGPRF